MLAQTFRFLRPSLLAVFVAAGLGFQATAEAPKKAGPDTVEYWIEKVSDFYGSSPYSLVYVMEMDMNQQGMNIRVDGTGDLLVGDPEHMRMNLRMKMSMPQMLPEPINMDMLVVNDGEYIWTEMDNPMQGGKQVMKMSAEKAQAMSSDFGNMAGPNTGKVDPASQLEMMNKMMNLEVAGIAAGRVTLTGTVSDEFRASAGASFEALGEDALSQVRLVLDEATGALQEMTLGAPEKPFMRSRFEDLKILKKAEMKPESFRYQPPEGVSVEDISDKIEVSPDGAIQPPAQ